MDPNRNSPSSADLSALAWVHDELRRSLEAAHKALRRHLRESQAHAGSDVDKVDPAVLRGARHHLHQGAGALELVGLPAAAQLLRASEAAVQRLATRTEPMQIGAVESIERASFALLDYIARRLAGKPLPALALFPQYRAVQELAGADRIHPADLWSIDWDWREIEIEPEVTPRAADPRARLEFEVLLLALMRGDTQVAPLRASTLFTALAAGAPELASRALWQLAAAFYEGQARGLIRRDVYAKRVNSRLLAQLRLCERALESGNAQAVEVSERLAEDLLFFCAQARGPGRDAPRLAKVRERYALASGQQVDYEATRLGRFDPAWIAQARKRLTAAKDAWSAVAGDELHRLGSLAEQFALVGDSLQHLHVNGAALADALKQAAAHTSHSQRAPAPELAMEVATAMLSVDATLEDAEFDHPELGDRMMRLADRIQRARQGIPAGPLEPWMEELYRRVSDRQTMGSVVHELQVSLGEAEKAIDQFFRKPDDKSALLPVPNVLASMRGVLAVLGIEPAAQSVVRMRDEIDALIAGGIDAGQAACDGRFERIASNLGALGFLIDMLNVQPQLARSLFVYDSREGTLSPVMGRTGVISGFGGLEPADQGAQQLIERALSLAVAAASDDIPLTKVNSELERIAQEALLADQAGLAASISRSRAILEQAREPGEINQARRQVAEALSDFVVSMSASFFPPTEVGALRSASGAADQQLAPVAAPAIPASAPAVPAAAAAEPMPATADVGAPEDDEMREIFLEEAREVAQGAREAVAQLAEQADDLSAMTTVRRAFHTLKGSSRMVGLNDFGAAAWACEQLYNARLAEKPHADEQLLGVTGQAIAYLDDWIGAIADRRDGGHAAQAVERTAEALRLRGESVALPLPATTVTVGLPEGLPSAADLELPPLPAEPAVVEASTASATEPEASEPESIELQAGQFPSLELDLSSFEVPPPVEPVVPPMFDQVTERMVLADFSDESQIREPAAAETAENRPDALADDTFDLAPPVPDAVEMQPDEPSAAVPTAAPDFAEIGLAAVAESAPEAAQADEDMEEAIKVIGPLRIPIPLFNIFLNEADEQSRRLSAELAEWTHELDRGPGESAVALAHSLAGNAAAVGYHDLSDLARAVEHGLEHVQAIGSGMPDEAQLFNEAGEEIRRLLHQFAAGFLKSPQAGLRERLAAHEVDVAQRLEVLASRPPAVDSTLEATLEDFAPTLVDRPAEQNRPESIVMDAFEPDALQAGESAPTAATTADETTADTAVPLAAEAVPAAELPIDDFATQELAAFDAPTSDLATPREEPVAPPIEFPAEATGAADLATARADLSAPDSAVPAQLATDIDGVASTEPPAEPVPEATMPTEVPPSMAEPGAGAEPLIAGVGEEDEAPRAEQPPALQAPAPAEPPLSRYAPFGPTALHTLTERTEPAAPARGESKTPLADIDEDIDAVDAVDPELFPIFEEEGQELLPQLAARLREWLRRPGDVGLATGCMRTLHTLKGGARLAGAMLLGEMAHRLESAIEREIVRVNAGEGETTAEDIEPLQARVDALSATFDALRLRDTLSHPHGIDTPIASVLGPAGAAAHAEAATTQAPAERTPEMPAGADWPALELPLSAARQDAQPAETTSAAAGEPTLEIPSLAASDEARATPSAGIDWSQFRIGERVPSAETLPLLERRSHERVGSPGAGVVRVRAPLLERVVNHAGEVSIRRARIEAEVSQVRGSLNDLDDNLERLRTHLRELELQGESQIASRIEAAKAMSQEFDPLEMDRFTRFQELTRMMAESVNDVATVQRALRRVVQTTEDELAAQSRLTRDLQDDLLRTRMVEFESLADRLYRVIRQAAKETGKQVRMDIVGGTIEVDRGVLDRMTGSFEHLLRNCVTHGIESPESRMAADKDPTGQITVTLSHEGNEVGVEFRDDGAGLDLAAIRARAEAMGLLEAGRDPTDAELAHLIFTPGFSTAKAVTELAGRGIGMDVVRSEVAALGGRVDTATTVGRGTSFRLVLPLTTAVTQVVMLRCGETTVAVPSTLIELVRRASPAEIAEAYARGSFALGERALPFFWLGALLQTSSNGLETATRSVPLVIVRSAQQAVALHVDEVLGNQEVVVKNLGPQLARLPGLVGITLLASGAVMLIYNPVALAALHGESALAAMREALAAPATEAPGASVAPAALAPLVLVVDDSLTVRRVTQRLLLREGYRVALAKDGLEALERLAEERPAVVLSDIEMPRMDGFDLVRNMRADPNLAALPVVMITSRIAQRHRDYAAELGVDHYLGKPYSEDELLSLIGHYAAATVVAA
jgi:chemosensory pili system protein ChpA (sensor histidine kinase/response regulator)